MSETQNTATVVLDPVELAKIKRKALFEFYENIKNGTEIFSAEDLDVAIESMKLAQLDIKERERKRLQVQEAELLKKKLEEDEKRRVAAEKRAAALQQNTKSMLKKLQQWIFHSILKIPLKKTIVLTFTVIVSRTHSYFLLIHSVWWILSLFPQLQAKK